MYRSPLARHSVFVVAQNLVLGARVKSGHGIYPAQQILKLAKQDASMSFGFELLPAFFQGLVNGFGERFAGDAGHLPGQPLSGVVFYAKRHNLYLYNTWYKYTMCCTETTANRQLPIN